MHNNFTIDRGPKPQKLFYTVVEAAVLLARSVGAKSANDPRIAHYTQLLLQSLRDGDLKSGSEPSETGQAFSLSSRIPAPELRRWKMKHAPDASLPF